jgi:ribosomal protein S15P/S13E
MNRRGMSLIRHHIKRLARALYRKTVTSENSQIQELGHYYPTGDKHLRPLSLLASSPARYSNLK